MFSQLPKAVRWILVFALLAGIGSVALGAISWYSKWWAIFQLSIFGLEGALFTGGLTTGLLFLQTLFNYSNVENFGSRALLLSGMTLGIGAAMPFAFGMFMRLLKYPNWPQFWNLGLLGFTGAGLLIAAALVNQYLF